MSYQLVVFDWDGTLFDSSQFIVHCVQRAAEIAELPIPEANTVKQMIGLSFDQALKRAMPELSPMNAANMVRIYRQCVQESDVGKPVLFNGAREVLKSLVEQGYWLAIATGKGRAGLNADLADLGLQDLFLATRCAEETQSKPHPQMLLELMDEMGVTANQTVMVGDTEYDLQLAENSGVDAVAALYGAHSYEQLMNYKAKYFLNAITDLPIWLAQQK